MVLLNFCPKPDSNFDMFFIGRPLVAIEAVQLMWTKIALGEKEEGKGELEQTWNEEGARELLVLVKLFLGYRCACHTQTRLSPRFGGKTCQWRKGQGWQISDFEMGSNSWFPVCKGSELRDFEFRQNCKKYKKAGSGVPDLYSWIAQACTVEKNEGSGVPDVKHWKWSNFSDVEEGWRVRGARRQIVKGSNL